ncbi:hypothetical protein D3C76_1654770 [compost metagenome]
MSERPNALLEIHGSYSFPDYRKKTAPSFDQCVLTLTELGKEVAAGEKDWVKVHGIDECYGGLRLQDDLAWRWDSEKRLLVYID